MRLVCILPAHNEGASIYETLAEIDQACSLLRPPIESVMVFVSEDGSRDNTREEVERAAGSAKHCEIVLSNPGPRLGYSRAILRGVQDAPGDAYWFMDSDGQYDPKEVWDLVPLLTPGALVVGFRNPRRDSLLRKAYSRAFCAAYRIFGGPDRQDPSSPFILGLGSDLSFLSNVEPHLPYGFWWEFQLRCADRQLSVIEVPITHRVRSTGDTQVYKFRALPKIAASHLTGLGRLRRELHHESRKNAAQNARPATEQYGRN